MKHFPPTTETRIATLSTSIEHCTESSTQGNEERHKRHPHTKGEGKAISIHRQ